MRRQLMPQAYLYYIVWLRRIIVLLFRAVQYDMDTKIKHKSCSRGGHHHHHFRFELQRQFQPNCVQRERPPNTVHECSKRVQQIQNGRLRLPPF